MVTLTEPILAFKRCVRPNPLILAGLFLTLTFLGPILAVFWAAFGDSGGLWAHLFDTVIPRYVANTLILMLGVGGVSLIFGVPSAWIVFRYDFKGRDWFKWMLLLPAAVPAYLIAYTYTDFLEYAGPLQKILRDVFEWQSARDYWFPEVRSMGGAMLVMGSVLYPYVYVMARVAFIMTPASIYEVGMLSNRSLFWKIGLPLGRPAIVAGLALVLMETVSDFGTVEYFAIETLTLGIFNVWLGMNNLAAAAQIAAVTFIFIILLLALEILARARRRFTDTTRKSVVVRPKVLKGVGGLLCCIACSFPIMIGFFVPVLVLAGFVVKGYSLEFEAAALIAAINSVMLAAAAALLILVSATFLGFVGTFKGGIDFRRMTAVASIGYAFPGTILAIGVLTLGGVIDDSIEFLSQKFTTVSYQGWFTSGVVLIVFACVVRFQAIGYGAVTSGLERLPPNLMDANRMLGHGIGHGMRKVILPFVSLPVVAGGLLVFVDVMKELPMTLLLRPFNFETLPTYVYQFAKDELLEEAALPALIIVATGIIPVIVMNSVLGRLTRR